MIYLSLGLNVALAAALVLQRLSAAREHGKLVDKLITLKVEPQVLVHRQIMEDLPTEPAFISPFDDEAMAENFDKRLAEAS